MAFISRLLRFIGEEDNPEEAEQFLETDEEDGLFMSTGSERNRPEEGELAGEAEDPDAPSSAEAPREEAMAPEDAVEIEAEPDASLGGSETSAKPDDSLEPTQASAEASASTEDPTAAAAAAGQDAGPAGGPTEQETGATEEADAGQNDDDPLSAFRGTATGGETTDLAKEIEDTSIEELLTGLRDIRTMLPSKSTDVDAGQEGDG